MVEDDPGGYFSTAEYYDHVVPYQERPDVNFYLEAAREYRGPVLEIGCGTGRVLLPTARAGIAITGLDMSEHMLKICKERLAGESEDVQARVEIVRGDMRNFELGRVFRLITIPFRPFQHLLTVEDQASALGCVHRHLEDGGRLIFDVFNPMLSALVADNVGQEIVEEPGFSLPDGRRVVRSHKIVSRDLFRQVQEVELIYDVTYPDRRSVRAVHAFSMRYFFRYEIEHLLARCGFQLEQVYADFEKNPYGSIYPGDLVMVAAKA